MSPLHREDFENALAGHPELIAGFVEPDKFGGSELVFLRHGDTFFSISLRPSQRLIWITGAMGRGMEWLRELKKFGLCNGYQWVGFKTKRDNKAVQALAKYWKAKLMAETDSGDEYCAPLIGR